jgi:biopolymer transport protein ExbB
VKELAELVDRGGWVMPVILALSFILYWRCFTLLAGLMVARRRALRAAAGLVSNPEAIHELQAEAVDSFRRQRAMLGSMIAAAPLLGLLGTVSGMERTFEGLSQGASQQSMEALSKGISEVLVATESGLAVAIPAMLLVYVAHRLVQGQVEALNRIARTGGTA